MELRHRELFDVKIEAKILPTRLKLLYMRETVLNSNHKKISKYSGTEEKDGVA